jgi:hypothetical protein
MTDARVEAFLADILALEGEKPNAIREGVHVALADCADILKAQEVNRRMKDKAVHACHVLCRARVLEEIRLRKGTGNRRAFEVRLECYRWATFPGQRHIARPFCWLTTKLPPLRGSAT